MSAVFRPLIVVYGYSPDGDETDEERYARLEQELEAAAEAETEQERAAREAAFAARKAAFRAKRRS